MRQTALFYVLSINCHDLIKSEKYLYDGVRFEGIIGSWYEYTEIDEYTDWVKKSDKSAKELKTIIEEELTNSLLKWQIDFLKEKVELLK